jgi:hypothetical protein
MATYYCDTGLASGANNGTSFDNAYRTIKAAFERNSYGTGDILWVRRRSTHTHDGASITPNAASDATEASPIRWIGWPRTTVAITSSDWTNGSTAVVIDDGGMTRVAHQGRYITGPDGKDYLITRVVDANNIVICSEYTGSTVTNQAATIAADEDYAEAQAIDDSAWTIKKAAWNGDAHTLPSVDFGANAFNLQLGGTVGPLVIKNMEFRNSNNSLGTIYARRTFAFTFEGCLFYQDQNTMGINAQSEMNLLFERCIFEGNSAGSSQILLSIGSGVIALARNSAIYNSGDYGMSMRGSAYLENVNIGVEQSNDDDDINLVETTSAVTGKNVKLGGTNGLIDFAVFGGKKINEQCARFENYGKILGAQRTWFGSNTTNFTTRLPVVAGSGDPYKRSGGSDDVLQIFCRTARAPGWEIPVAQWHFWADTTSKSYRVYCQQVAIPTITAAQAFLEATYVDEYDDTSEYHTARVVSDETIAVRSGADDWSQYLEVTGIEPAVAGWVTIRLMVQWDDADGFLYVDPMVVIT